LIVELELENFAENITESLIKDFGLLLVQNVKVYRAKEVFSWLSKKAAHYRLLRFRFSDLRKHANV
jgi:hypothetical protein